MIRPGFVQLCTIESSVDNCLLYRFVDVGFVQSSVHSHYVSILVSREKFRF
jgi:hypothetical protein